MVSGVEGASIMRTVGVDVDISTLEIEIEMV